MALLSARTQEAAPAPAASAPKVPFNVVVLEREIKTHKGPVRELVFGPVTAGLLIKHTRLPWSVRYFTDGSARDECDYAVAAAFICDMTGIDSIEIGQLTARDMAQCIEKLFTVLTADSGAKN